MSFNLRKEIFSAFVSRKENEENSKAKDIEKWENEECKEKGDGRTKRGIVLLEKSDLSFAPLKGLNYNI